MKLSFGKRDALLSVAVASVFAAASADAAPYASGVSINGTTVSFVLNEPAVTLTATLADGSVIKLDGSTTGNKTFTIPTATTPFKISAGKVDYSGYSLPTGQTVSSVANNTTQSVGAFGYHVINDLTNPLYRFNAFRGFTVNTDPNSPNFGTQYVANGSTGTSPGANNLNSNGTLPARTGLTQGIYALNAAGGALFGTAVTGKSIPEWDAAPTASAPIRISLASDGSVYSADNTNASGNVWHFGSDLSVLSNRQLLANSPSVTLPGAPPATDTTQNHGSTLALAVTGSNAAANLSAYTIDDDLTSDRFTATGGPAIFPDNPVFTSNPKSIWKYSPGSTTDHYAGSPVRINRAPIIYPTSSTNDLAVGGDGKIYVTNSISAGDFVNEDGRADGFASLTILNPDGTKAFDSRTATQALFGLDSTASDLFNFVYGVAVSPDQTRLALGTGTGGIAYVPLTNGIPDLSKTLFYKIDSQQYRTLAFDAADNLYVGGSGGVTRVLTPGGTEQSTLTYNGSTFSFAESLTAVPTTVSGTWALSTGGSWNSTASWTTGAIPTGAGATATFGASLTSSATVTLDAPQTVGHILFNNAAASYTITPGAGGTLSINNQTASPTGVPDITVNAGRHTITAPIFLPGGLTLATASGTALTLSGVITGTGPLIKTGAGALTVSAANLYTGGTTLSGGSVEVTPNGTLSAGGPLTLTGSTLTFDAPVASTVQLRAFTAISVDAASVFTVRPSATHASRTLLTASGGLTDAGKLDLGNGDADFVGDLNTITGYVASGFRGTNGVPWTGTGISSAAAATDTAHVTALGVIRNNQSGTALFGPANPFDGVRPLAADIIIKYTYYGDANLDGVVDGSDYSLIDDSYNFEQNAPGLTISGWFNGDFNYDGVVDGSDYTLIDNAFNTQPLQPGSNSAGLIAVDAAQFGAGAVAVPEPATLGLLALSLIGLSSRRRK